MMKEEEWANESAKRTFFQRHKQVMNHFLAGGKSSWEPGDCFGVFKTFWKCLDLLVTAGFPRPLFEYQV